jgi:hypothetical protein
MSEYVVQCAKFLLCPADSDSQHVYSVATGQWPLHNRIWLVTDVCIAMAQGDQFYIQSRETFEKFRLCCRKCPVCKAAETLETEDPKAGMKVWELHVLH